MTRARTGTEILRALLVLALIFLNFAHQPAMAAPSAGDVMTLVASQSFCGSPIADDTGHAPCHACRIGGGADLPPPCDIALPVAVLADVAYGAMPTLSLPATPIHSFDARGPPSA